MKNGVNVPVFVVLFDLKNFFFFRYDPKETDKFQGAIGGPVVIPWESRDTLTVFSKICSVLEHIFYVLLQGYVTALEVNTSHGTQAPSSLKLAQKALCKTREADKLREAGEWKKAEKMAKQGLKYLLQR